MKKIKIISNPYERRISCEIFAEEGEENPFKTEELSGFFPFQVKSIVDKMVDLAEEEPVEIIFEGTEDEYRELEEVCRDEAYDGRIHAVRGERYLENARDILPDIISMFRKITPLISECMIEEDRIQRELEQFSDASNDVIPLCVLGNYSSGKSTFINALIGNEILPTGDEPVTSKIYKITKSDQDDRGNIRFEQEGSTVNLRFYGESYKISEEKEGDTCAGRMEEALREMEGAGLIAHMSRVLELLNHDDEISKDPGISDLIEIEVPFREGLMKSGLHHYVIFDTPGSNSASNDKHVQVMKKAMENMTNGIPIYVSEYDALDSTDNEKLYREIHKMEELDSRFTMIVVNKADSARLPAPGFSTRDEARILNESIPENLYGQGIYFVSSVMGLGAKNKGEFLDEHYSEIYDDQERKYSDPSAKHYKTLYKYNIMPYQIRKKTMKDSVRHPDRMLANSGLYAVEKAIDTFASRYAAYNKCHQSYLFLKKIIDITEHEIKGKCVDRENSKKNRMTALGEDKKKLVYKLEDICRNMENDAILDYDAYMEDLEKTAAGSLLEQELIEKEKEILQMQKEKAGFQVQKETLRESREQLADNLKGNVKEAVQSRKIHSVKQLGKDFMDNVKDTKENKAVLEQKKKESAKAAANEMIRTITEWFGDNAIFSQNFLEHESRKFWIKRIKEIKEGMTGVIAGSGELNEEKRSELSAMILKYKEMDFKEKAEEIFIKDRFVRGFKIGRFSIGDTEHLNLGKLSRTYNQEMEDCIMLANRNIQETDCYSFEKWLETLLELLRENMEEYSPVLRSQANIIKEETRRIEELETRKICLTQYTAQIEKMMGWIQ